MKSGSPLTFRGMDSVVGLNGSAKRRQVIPVNVKIDKIFGEHVLAILHV